MMRRILPLLLLLAGSIVMAQQPDRAAAAQSAVTEQLTGSWQQPATEEVKYMYEQAFWELKAMLEGQKPLSFKRAVFVTENAYLGNRLDYAAFDRWITGMGVVCEKKAQEARPHYKSDWLAKNAAIYSFMKDTTRGIVGQDTLVHLPYQYDFEDFDGEKDWRKMFVTRLLVAGKGNCHSLPFLYRILAEQLGTEAYLSLAPNHVFIKHRNDEQEYDWFNVELTSGTFPQDAWLMGAGYISKQAVMSGTYLDTLDLRQSVALCLVDLAKGYERLFARQNQPIDNRFAVACAKLALQHNPTYINAKLLWAETLNRQLLALVKQHGAEAAQTLPQARTLLEQMERLYGELEQAGYREMPPEMYLHWLATVQNGGKEPEAYKDTTLFDEQEGNPFREAGQRVPVVTLSKGRYREFAQGDTLVRLGSVIYDRIGKRIAYLIDSQEQSSEAAPEPEVSSRWFSVDPLTDSQESYSPYHYVYNNPVRFTDPDGRAPDDPPGFWSGVAEGFTGTFAAIGNAVAHPVETFQKVVAGDLRQMAADPHGFALETALNAGSGGLYNEAKQMVGFGQAVASGDASTAGRMVGQKGAEATIALATEGVARGVSALKGGSNIAARAEELHNTLHPLKRDLTATTIIEGVNASGKKIRVVGHSDKYLPGSIKKALKEGEIATPIKLGKADVPAGSSAYHSEQVAGEGAKQLGFTPKKIAVVGQPICDGCNQYIKDNNLKVIRKK